MNLEDASYVEAWVKTLPASKMVRPVTLARYAKYVFWGFYTPYHSRVRDALTSLGIVKHEGRQDFFLGFVADHLSLQEFISRLVEQGFGNHFVAWREEGELVSLRYVENFEMQYHLRVFKDREVRGHYEYTPECHAVWHMREVDMEERRPQFLDFLGDVIVSKPADKYKNQSVQ
ncbi:MAG TPA: hypothetical protein VK675_02905 [Candidatus Paceibacterota bacterium]|jgi:hypothetical protein|nr:hypothetical protein [Candidatus Paceibacterota bacterium]